MARSPYLTWHPRRTPLSVLAALVIVPVVGLTTKVVVEGVTSWTYTIHWFETVPVLVVALAVALNGQWNQRARQGSSQR